MKKVLLGACALSFIASANANVICDEVSYTGLFGGLGVVFSFDKNKVNFMNEHADRNKTAFGGQIVIGYGHQFDNNLYVGIMHESLFSSKAEVNYDWKTRETGAKNTSNIKIVADINSKQSRKCWTPSFGLAMGYVVDGWNFGIRGGIQLDKLKADFNLTTPAALDSTKSQTAETHALLSSPVSSSASISATSPYVGAYVEYKMGSFIGYLNVDRVFGKKKDLGGSGTVKRPSWKAAAGVKFNVNLMN